MAISPLFSSNPYENLITQIIEYESIPKQRLEARLENKQDLMDIIGTADSKLSALNSAIEPFTAGSSSNPFDALAAVVGDTDAFTASASDSASVGTHSLEIEQLAKTDTRISQQYSDTGTALADWFSKKGNNGQGYAQTFEITVAHPTDTDPDNRVSISVTVDPGDPTGKTNEQLLNEIKTAIDTAMQDAVDAGTIDADEKVSVSVVNESDSTVRLSIRSADTGYTNRIGFTDSADGLLAELEVNNNVVASGTGGGQVYDVGTGETDTALNSIFTLDGITMYRDSNTVTDALEGVTLELKQAGGPQDEFSIEADSEAIVKEIEEFIEKFNAVQEFLRAKTSVDEDTMVRGPLASDYAFRTLGFHLRDDVVSKVTSQAADAPEYLSDIGITIQEDGTLTLEDESKLIEAVEENAEEVKSLFNGSDGVATRLEERLGTFLDTGGLIDDEEDSINANIDRLNDRIEEWDQRLMRRENQLRQKFARVQQMLVRFRSQQRFLGRFGGGFF